MRLAMIAAILLVGAAPATAQSPADESVPKAATVDDMAVLEPYVGRFRSEDKTYDNSDVTYFFVIDYQWYDKKKTILRYKLERHSPALDRIDGIGEGYYYFDSSNGRIGVFGVFPDGRMGQGSMGEFDRQTSSRAVWVSGTSPDGKPVQVRDAFEIIDKDHWRNVTQVRLDGGDWQVIGRDTYTRMTD